MTNVQQMTDEELSRWIAKKLEPEQQWQQMKYSPLQCWKLQKRFTGHTFEYRWCPREFTTEPEMSMMLLEKMAADDAVFIEEFNGWRVMLDWGPTDGSERIHAVASTLGRAIAEAYALSLGDESK